MYRRDYLQKQIDQLGKVLGKALADLLGLKEQGNIASGVAAISETFKAQLDLELDELLVLDTTGFAAFIQSEKQVNKDNLEVIANIFLTLADELRNSSRFKSEALYDKSLALFEFLEKTDEIYSYDRFMKMERIRKMNR